MRLPTDYDTEKLFEAVDGLRARGKPLDDILWEVGQCWVESHREAFDGAEKDAARRIFTPIRGG